MKITANGKSANVKLFGVRSTHYLGGGNSKDTIYIANSMKGIIQPFSYSLEYADYSKRNPKSTKTLCSTLNGTGSYWSLRGHDEPLTQAEIAEYIKKADSKDIETLITTPDSYISIY